MAPGAGHSASAPVLGAGRVRVGPPRHDRDLRVVCGPDRGVRGTTGEALKKVGVPWGVSGGAERLRGGDPPPLLVADVGRGWGSNRPPSVVPLEDPQRCGWMGGL